jgi:hypothetical protein
MKDSRQETSSSVPANTAHCGKSLATEHAGRHHRAAPAAGSTVHASSAPAGTILTDTKPDFAALLN